MLARKETTLMVANYHSVLYARHGPRAVWILEALVISAMCALWLLAYRRLVPLEVPADLIDTTPPHSTLIIPSISGSIDDASTRTLTAAARQRRGSIESLISESDGNLFSAVFDATTAEPSPPPHSFSGSEKEAAKQTDAKSTQLHI